LILLQWIFFSPEQKEKTTGAISLEQILLPEKIFDFAPVDFFFTGAKKKKKPPE
jgi:hypothetical protein